VNKRHAILPTTAVFANAILNEFCCYSCEFSLWLSVYAKSYIFCETCGTVTILR